MDRIDQHILMLLQKDARQSTADIADKVGLSPSPCARRIKRLEEEGVIANYRASLSKDKVGVGMTVFVEVSLSNHQASSIDDFEQAVQDMEEVVSCTLCLVLMITFWKSSVMIWPGTKPLHVKSSA